MDLQRWMTRFHLLANRLIESWMDLTPALTMNDQTVITTIAERRVVHDEHQQNLAVIAQATPGAAAHVPVPWTDEMSRLVLQQMNLARRTAQRQQFPLKICQH